MLMVGPLGLMAQTAGGCEYQKNDFNAIRKVFQLVRGKHLSWTKVKIWNAENA